MTDPTHPAPTPAQYYTVYLRATASRSDMPGYRNAMCVVTPTGELIGEYLDWPVLNRAVLARSATEARARFIEWQRGGYDPAWLLRDPEDIEKNDDERWYFDEEDVQRGIDWAFGSVDSHRGDK